MERRPDGLRLVIVDRDPEVVRSAARWGACPPGWEGDASSSSCLQGDGGLVASGSSGPPETGAAGMSVWLGGVGSAFDFVPVAAPAVFIAWPGNTVAGIFSNLDRIFAELLGLTTSSDVARCLASAGAQLEAVDSYFPLGEAVCFAPSAASPLARLAAFRGVGRVSVVYAPVYPYDDVSPGLCMRAVVRAARANLACFRGAGGVVVSPGMGTFAGSASKDAAVGKMLEAWSEALPD
ncbi:hypothetical protein DIPPA_24460 [Diplonema papillatum]|nr:hypothetical protein DIPPA_24460 [Diplonema papillatum]